MPSFGRETTTDEVLEGIDLTGRLALVTGGYSGIGTETTRALVRAGARVVVPARRPERAREELADLGDAVELTGATCLRPGHWSVLISAPGRAGPTLFPRAHGHAPP